MDTIGFILVGLLGLCVVVTIHEYGHMIAAKWAGVEVEAFAIGWGKVLWSWKPRTTEYRVCLLPLGGYCKMKGEQDLTAALQRQDGAFEPTPGSLFAAPPWKRIIISVAGPVFNLLFAFLVFSALQLTGVPETGPAARVLLASEVEGRAGLPADQAGLQTGDLVLSIDGKAIRTFGNLQQAIAASNGQAQAWKIDRQGQRLDKTVVPRYDAAEKRALVGVYPLVDPVVKSVTKGSAAELAGFRPGDRITAVGGTPAASTQAFYQAVTAAGNRNLSITVQRDGGTIDLLFVPDPAAKEGPGLAFSVPTFPAVGQQPLAALASGWDKVWELLGQMGNGLVQLFTGKVNPADSLSGPLRITYYAGEITSQGFLAGWGQGWGAVANIFAFISLALFLMNLLPLPALDGGTIVLSAVEALRRRRLGLKALMRYQQVGVVLILGLVLFTTFNDLGFLLGPK